MSEWVSDEGNGERRGAGELWRKDISGKQDLKKQLAQHFWAQHLERDRSGSEFWRHQAGA